MFKFYTIPDVDLLQNIIGTNRTLKFSSAFNLNDPFELKFNLSLDPAAEGQIEEFMKVHPQSTEKDFKEWQDQVTDNDGFLWYTEQTQRATLSKMVTLSSFTEVNDNNLMWSHYSNNHKGICVEYTNKLFEHLKRTEGFLAFDKVSYSEEPPTVESLEPMAIKVKKMLFNKQLEWKYEKENRVVLLSDKDTDYIPIQPEHIKAVYIGSKASKEVTGHSVDICRNFGFECYYGISLGKTYKVTFQKHSETTMYMRTFWN